MFWRRCRSFQPYYDEFLLAAPLIAEPFSGEVVIQTLVNRAVNDTECRLGTLFPWTRILKQ